MDARQARRIVRIADPPDHYFNWLRNLIKLQNLGDKILAPWALAPGTDELSAPGTDELSRQFRECLAGAPEPMRPALMAVARKLAQPAAEKLIKRLVMFDVSNKPVLKEALRYGAFIRECTALAGMLGEPYEQIQGLEW
jgi:hypothetical protein